MERKQISSTLFSKQLQPSLVCQVGWKEFLNKTLKPQISHTPSWSACIQWAQNINTLSRQISQDLVCHFKCHLTTENFYEIIYCQNVSEWLSLTAFLGTVDIRVHVVHTSRCQKDMKERKYNFVVITVPADVPASDGAGPSAVAVMTMFGSRVSMEPAPRRVETTHFTHPHWSACIQRAWDAKGITVRNPLLLCPLVLAQDGGTRSRQKCLHRDFSVTVLFWVDHAWRGDLWYQTRF